MIYIIAEHCTVLVKLSQSNQQTLYISAHLAPKGRVLVRVHTLQPEKPPMARARLFFVKLSHSNWAD